MNILCKITLLAILFCAANLASAQQPPRTRVPLLNDLSYFIAQPAIQDELQLTETKKEAVTKLSEDAIKEHKNLRQAGPRGAESRKAVAELTAKNEKALKELLEPKQITRLNEITLQYRIAFDWFATLRGLSEQLSLSEEQKAQLLQLRNDQRAAVSKRMRDMQIQDFEIKARALRKEEISEAVKLLTEEQKKILDDLHGKDFDVSRIDDYVKP